MFEKILALSPHTDDAEIGCGGTLSKFKKKDRYPQLIAFSLSNLESLKIVISESAIVI